MTEFPQLDLGLVVPVFTPRDDPIACLNKGMAFMTVVAASSFPSTNNQLRTSSNPRNQATIQDDRVIVQQVQGRQGQSYVGNNDNATSSGGNSAGGQARVIKRYNFQGEGHMARKYTQPKRSRNAAWFKDKAICYLRDFGKRFIPQQEVSVEQAFWLQNSHPNTDQSDISPIKIVAPKELPKDKSCDNQNALEVLEYFENNNLKAQLQAKDTTISKLLSENELLHKEIEHLKKIYKDQFDSIKKTCALYKEHCDSLIAQLNSKRLKCKNVLDNATTINNATNTAPEMFKLDLDPLAPRLLKNRDAHIDYLKYTLEQADIFGGIFEQAKAKQPLDNALDFVYKHAKRIQELLVYVRDACPNANKPSEKLVAVANNSKPNHSWGSDATDVPSSSFLVNDRLSRLFSGIWTPDALNMTGNCSQLMNFVNKFLGTIRFRNDQIAKIMGYGDYQLGNVTILRVYYVEGLRYNLFSVGQFYDSELEVAFWKNTCFIQNLEGVDLLAGSRDTNLYTISLDDMLKTKSWLWHRWLLHLNFVTLNKLAKDGLARGILKLKSKKDHLCLACALGKSKKSSHQPKVEDTNRRKLVSSGIWIFVPVLWRAFNEKKNDWDRLFQPMFDEYFNPPSSIVSPVQVAATPRAIDIAGSPSSTTIDLDAPSTSSSSTNQQQQSSIISQGVEEPTPNAHFDDPCHEPLHDVSTSQESSSNV
ncbi:retrovirus-related pol polyprotein from transposon TNT 1-94 [Tanacetum coccineum]